MAIAEASVDITADTEKFERDVRRILRRVERERAEIEVDVDVDDAERDVEGLRRAIDSLGGAAGTAGRIGAIGGGIAVLGGAAAAATGDLIAFTAAVAPAIGILAAAPSGIGAAAAAFGTLGVALSGVSDAFEEALTGDAEDFAEAIEDLAPSAAATATALRDLAPAFEDLREAEQEQFFTGFDQALTDIPDTLLGPLTQGMSAVASEMNDFALGLAEIATSSSAIEFIEGIFDTVAGVIAQLEQPTLNLAQAFLDVGNAINAAFGPQLAAGLAAMVDNFASFLSAAADSGQAVAWVEGALQVFSQLGDVMGSLVGIFRSEEHTSELQSRGH